MTSVLDTQFRLSTLLGLKVDPEDIDERTADLMKKARQIWELCINEMEMRHYNDTDKALDGCYERTACAIQIITGISEWEAYFLTDILIKKYRTNRNG